MYVRDDTVTITLSTLGDGTDYSEDFNGLVHSVYVGISKAAGAGDKVTITSTDTTKAILTVTDPSTLGAWYYPRAALHGSTGNALASTAVGSVALCDERCKVVVAGSSNALASATATVKFNVI